VSITTVEERPDVEKKISQQSKPDVKGCGFTTSCHLRSVVTRCENSFPTYVKTPLCSSDRCLGMSCRNLYRLFTLLGKWRYTLCFPQSIHRE